MTTDTTPTPRFHFDQAVWHYDRPAVISAVVRRGVRGDEPGTIRYHITYTDVGTLEHDEYPVAMALPGRVLSERD